MMMAGLVSSYPRISFYHLPAWYHHLSSLPNLGMYEATRMTTHLFVVDDGATADQGCFVFIYHSLFLSVL
jgi:hypothetical protein